MPRERSGGDPCKTGRPWTVLLGGPQPAEAQVGLAFTEEFPCGVELDATGANVQPLQVLTSWSGRVGRFDAHGDGIPGELVLLQANVASFDRTVVGPTRIEWRSIRACEGISSQPRVKLRIKQCGFPEPVIIDSDASMVMRAGLATIDVLAPYDWVEQHTITDVEAEDTVLWTDTRVRISACPYNDHSPKAQLTEWVPYDPATVSPPMLVRPRRARRLEVSTFGPAAVTVQAFQQGVAAPVSQTNAAPLGQVAFDPWGAMPLLRVISDQPHTAHLRWEIDG